MVWEVRQDVHGPAAQTEPELDPDYYNKPGNTYVQPESEFMRAKLGKYRISEKYFHHLPTDVITIDPKNELPDVLGGSWFYVSPRFKEKLEELEPGGHQFFPVQLHGKRPNGEPYDETYFICQITTGPINILDQVDFEKSDLAMPLNPPPPRQASATQPAEICIEKNTQPPSRF